jgi:hypothetical protein
LLIHFLSLKILRKVLLYVSLTVAILLLAGISSVLLFKDKIIQQFIREANKQLSTPVKVGKIEVSIFEEFPKMSILLLDVYVEDSHEGIYPLITAKKASFQMDPIAVWKGDYTIEGIVIEDSETNLKISKEGENNYTVVKETDSKTNGTVKFELKDVMLKNTRVRYVDFKSNQDLNFVSSELKASIESTNNVYDIIADGQLTSEKIAIDGVDYLKGKSFDITSSLVYDDVEKTLLINPSTLLLGKAEFVVNGNYKWKTANLIDLITEGKNTDIQTIISLLPSSVATGLEKYQSDGDVYFRSKLRGEISKRKHPFFSVEFGFKNATIFHPDYKSKIERASMTGSFASANVSDPRQASLILKDIKGTLNNELFEGNFMMYNFVDPEVICNFKGKVDAGSVLNFYPIEELKNVTGSLIADIALEGKVELLKKKATAQRVSTKGTIDLIDINLEYGANAIPLQSLNGSLQFDNNDLALSNVKGQLGNSDFVLNGFFRNIITFLLFENQPIGIETDLKSNHIDLEQLFDIGFGTETSDAEYVFSISRNLYLNFNCDIASLNYKKFKARHLAGDLLVKNEVAVSRKLSFSSMGGDITLSGIVDAKNNKAIDVVTTTKLEGVNADSAFYVFENFQQDFINDKHLKGKTSADINLEMTLDQHLKLFQETLVGDISFVIKNGELNNFEPMKKLSKYVDDETLSRLRFSDLKNDIHIENKTVYIPQMDIRSNATSLKISGTHTFDQQIDYRIITPLRRKKIIDVDAQGAFEDTMDGQTKLFLKITGTADNYKVAYDTEAVKKKIGNDIKREVQELRDAFKTKGKQKQKEVELEKDDYFEWDNQE